MPLQHLQRPLRNRTFQFTPLRIKSHTQPLHRHLSTTSSPSTTHKSKPTTNDPTIESTPISALFRNSSKTTKTIFWVGIGIMATAETVFHGMWLWRKVEGWKESVGKE
jgi:hypothetical protein